MSRWPVPRQVPPPQGRTRRPQARFIPGEELQSFDAWQPLRLQQGQAQRKAAPSGAAQNPGERTWTQEELDALLQAAHQSAYQDGYRDGLAALESFKISHAHEMSAQVGQLLQSFDAQLQAQEQAMSQALVHCALELAKQVLRSELQMRPELVAQVAGDAVGELMRNARQVEVRVHPEDLDLVKEGAGERLEARGARLLADPSLERGGCIVDSDSALVDASLAQRWAQAQRTLLGDA